MTGYQEILTDPSYAGQMVTLTYPLIGNYGINADDFESRQVQVEGFIVREAAELASNWRSAQSLDAFLKARNVVGIQGIDTRALTRALRVRGVMMGAISTDETPDEILARLHAAPSYAGIDFARKVTTEHPYRWRTDSRQPEGLDAPPVDGQSERPEPRYRIALLDCGVKYNIIRSLAGLGCEVSVHPCTTTAAELLRDNPDGIMLSPVPAIRISMTISWTRSAHSSVRNLSWVSAWEIRYWGRFSAAARSN